MICKLPSQSWLDQELKCEFEASILPMVIYLCFEARLMPRLVSFGAQCLRGRAVSTARSSQDCWQ
jgi:hypothetical protein